MTNKQTGKIVRWQDDKGFGFIKTNNQQEVFFHIKDFRAHSRPFVGEEVVFEPSYDKQQRSCAKNVQQLAFVQQKIARQNAYDIRHQDWQDSQKVLTLWMVMSGLFMLILLGLVITHQLPLMILAWYIAIGLATFLLYAHDKQAAHTNSWRVEEATLHKLSLAGGWVGATFAHKILNHKSRKISFRKSFYLTVIGNVIVLAIIWWFKFR